MSQKKESDTLRQRKFAQQEFLELKKMQQGELKPQPKPSELTVPLTFKDKLKNIWYHDKLAVIIILLLTVAITLLCVQCATKTQYDATVVLFTYEITGEPNCKKIGEYLEDYCPDLNNDGEINVNVINCSINDKDNNTDYNYTNRTKVQSLIASDSSALLFITDTDSYEYLMSLSKEISFFEGEPLKFDDDFYKYCIDESGFYTTPDDLQISCRTITGTAIENNKNVETYYKQAQAVLNNLQANADKK